MTTPRQQRLQRMRRRQAVVLSLLLGALLSLPALLFFRRHGRFGSSADILNWLLGL